MDDEELVHPLSLNKTEITNSYQRIINQNRRNEREIRRLRNSVSFKLGLHLTSAIRQPWRLLILPISFPIFALKLGLQRLGKRAMDEELSGTASDSKERNHSIVLFPTNGVGFGHFTRMYAVARALRKQDPALEIIFFTPMPTLHILYSDQFPTYHLAGRYKHADMTATQWNGLVEDMLYLIFQAHRPKWFMFDGAFPYRGMLNAIAAQPNMEKWWMRRGSIKANKSIPVDSQQFFDGVIIPGEGIDQELDENEHQVAPIRAIEPDEAWDRDFARSRLSVPNDAKVVYVQLGAGRINDIESDLQKVLDILFEYPNLHVVLGESMLGERLSYTHERLRIIRDYPNALYAKAFDASVQAGGYNSYQEMRMFGIPTLFIPNTETGMDDQVARCRKAEQEGWGIVCVHPSKENLNESIGQLLDFSSAEGEETINGAVNVASLLLE